MHQTVIWKQKMEDGMEYCTFQYDSRMSIEGTVIARPQDDHWLIQYKVDTDKEGITQGVHIKFRHGEGEQIVQIRRQQDGQWFSNGLVLPACAGLSFIDIGVTPATNSLPIRAFQLKVGEAQTFSAVWVRFPQLTVEPLHQKYERLDESTYRYTSIESGYTALLEVDEHGIVTDYEGEWTALHH